MKIKYLVSQNDLEKMKKYIAGSLSKDKAQEDYVGKVIIGNLSVEFVLREYENGRVVDFDIYVGGVDSGYGYTEKNHTPYDYAQGGILLDIGTLDKVNKLDDLKNLIINKVFNFISNNENQVLLLEKANEEENLIDWE